LTHAKLLRYTFRNVTHPVLQRAVALHYCSATGILGWSNPPPVDKPETWIEIQTPHFIVASNDGENTARRFADEFEQIRFLYSKALNPGLHLDPAYPILIFAVKNEKSLSQLIPEYWAEKGHTHPAGLFVPGQERITSP